MKTFIIHTSIFLTICIASCLAVFSLADGSTDAYYLKFTTPKQSSLIIGSSRAAQGIIPSTIKAESPEHDYFNYAFTVVQSAYGQTYLESIKRKLAPKPKDANFIVCVNAWVVSSETKSIEDSLHFREVNSYLANTRFVNMNPNFEYLAESFNSKNADIIRNKYRKGEYQTFYVHDDGWLEVTIESDMVSREERTRRKIDSYRKQLARTKGPSLTRMNKLRESISYLKKRGKVVMVRLPINDEMLQLERELIPEFSTLMTKLSEDLEINYIDAMPNRYDYEYTDGHHLTIESAHEFSKYLAGELNKIKTDQF